jgi:hypothetical protein
LYAGAVAICAADMRASLDVLVVLELQAAEG